VCVFGEERIDRQQQLDAFFSSFLGAAVLLLSHPQADLEDWSLCSTCFSSGLLMQQDASAGLLFASLLQQGMAISRNEQVVRMAPAPVLLVRAREPRRRR